MIRLVYGPRFMASVRGLPAVQQKKLAHLLERFQQKPFDSMLHTKRLVGELAGFHSFRITRDWRVIFQFVDEETIQLLRAIHRKDAYH